MIRRFSLRGEFGTWAGNIEEDPQGAWVRWKDILPYLPEHPDYVTTEDVRREQYESNLQEQASIRGQDVTGDPLEVEDDEDLEDIQGDLYDIVTRTAGGDHELGSP